MSLPPPPSGPNAAPTPQAPRPVRFTEPTEGAFTLVVPEGWDVEAGVVRAGGDARN